MSLRCKLGYHAFEIVNVDLVKTTSDDGSYTVCIMKEYRCRRCGARDFKQTWESEACRRYFEANYPCNKR